GGAGYTVIDLPWGDLARNETAVIVVAAGLSLALVVLLGAWAAVILRPTRPRVPPTTPGPGSPGTDGLPSAA
ncbi:MAG: hypothetical protein WCK58_10415, partial [Chloroflexota bacterium]